MSSTGFFKISWKLNWCSTINENLSTGMPSSEVDIDFKMCHCCKNCIKFSHDRWH